MADQYPTIGWFPTVTGDDLSRDITLKINPKYLLPQVFRAEDQLADPCMLRASLPEWWLPETLRKQWFPSAPQERSDVLAFVAVTPRVGAWVGWANRTAGVGCEQLALLSPLWRELIEPYLSTRFKTEEVSEAFSFVESHLGSGGDLSAIFPRIDPIVHEMVRYGLASPWNGYDQWSRQFPTDQPNSPPPPPPPQTAPPKSARPRAKAQPQESLI